MNARFLFRSSSLPLTKFSCECFSAVQEHTARRNDSRLRAGGLWVSFLTVWVWILAAEAFEWGSLYFKSPASPSKVRKTHKNCNNWVWYKWHRSPMNTLAVTHTLYHYSKIITQVLGLFSLSKQLVLSTRLNSEISVSIRNSRVVLFVLNGLCWLHAYSNGCHLERAGHETSWATRSS